MTGKSHFLPSNIALKASWSFDGPDSPACDELEPFEAFVAIAWLPLGVADLPLKPRPTRGFCLAARGTNAVGPVPVEVATAGAFDDGPGRGLGAAPSS